MLVHDEVPSFRKEMRKIATMKCFPTKLKYIIQKYVLYLEIAFWVLGVNIIFFSDIMVRLGFGAFCFYFVLTWQNSNLSTVGWPLQFGGDILLACGKALM